MDFFRDDIWDAHKLYQEEKEMSDNHRIIELAGLRSFKIPVAEAPKDDSASVKTPEWMVNIDLYTSSDIAGYENYTELFGWHAQSSRFTSGNTGSGQLFTSATLKHSDVVLLISNGGHAPQLEIAMNAGTALTKVEIVRLGNNAMRLQTIEYGLCRLQMFQQQLDRLVLFLNVTTKMNVVYVYDKNGTNTGQIVSKTDYSSSKSE